MTIESRVPDAAQGSGNRALDTAGHWVLGTPDGARLVFDRVEYETAGGRGLEHGVGPAGERGADFPLGEPA